MAQPRDQQQQQQAKSKAHGQQGQTGAGSTNRKSTPMIVERVNKYPMVNLAISMGFTQYDKLKSSNVTVGDLMSKAEGWAAYLWEKAQPVIEKLQDPISKVDKIACDTLDFVEGKLNNVKVPVLTFKNISL